LAKYFLDLLGLIKAGLCSSGLKQLSGLAHRNSKYGAVCDITQNSSVASLWGGLRRRGWSQRSDFMHPTTSSDGLLQKEKYKDKASLKPVEAEEYL